MARTVWLLRHAMPVVHPALPPGRWPLSPGGEDAARALAGQLPADVVRVTSPETKARRTLELASPGPSLVDERFAEVCRPTEPVGPAHRELRRAWVAGHVDERHAAWEPPDEAGARFAAGVAATTGDVVIATHGMVLTAWLVTTGRLGAGEEAARWWEALAFPALLRVDAD